MMWTIRCTTLGCPYRDGTWSDNITELMRGHTRETGHRHYDVGLADKKRTMREATLADITLRAEGVYAV